MPRTNLRNDLTSLWAQIISETNGIAILDTVNLMLGSIEAKDRPEIQKSIAEFRDLLLGFQSGKNELDELLQHPMGLSLFDFFKNFPIPFRDEHTHLTGALHSDYLFPRLNVLLNGPNKDLYKSKIEAVYGKGTSEIRSSKDIERLIVLKDDERFSRYLSILFLPKLILTSREAYVESGYHLASEVFNKYNVGFIRLKFTLSRASTSDEQIPGLEDVDEEDVVTGLYEGLMRFRREQPKFDFVLAPSFRKEADFFDSNQFKSKEEHFLHQVDAILKIIEKHPELGDRFNEVDTVGNEMNLYRKSHFQVMKMGFRRLQYRGFKIRSHHGEVWQTLKKGIQAVDNAMNIWRIDTLEHGLSLGVNPNYYFHSMFQRILKWNARKEAVRPGTAEQRELSDMEWSRYQYVQEKLLQGTPLNSEEIRLFTKAKFHLAREVESYQHDVLNRMIDKGMSLVALPSSNKKLTDCFEDYKDHPFSWWEKKSLQLGVGTDNYITLDTNFIKEMLIILFTDINNLKITKLLMVATGENRRPYISHLLWQMRP